MSLTFLRWLRQGAAAGVTLPEGVVGAPARPRFPVGTELAVHRPTGAAATLTPGGPNLQLYGPADVVGLDLRQIIRTVPEQGASAFEPGHFAHVELDRPDLPWMFAPFRERPADPDPNAALQSDGRLLGETLTPWLCLVVVEQTPGVELAAAVPLAVLTVPTLEELPPLAQAHAWAHVAILGDVTAAAAQRVVEKESQRAVSRLLCPRRLRPGIRYHACLVPTYRGGRDAGLGLPVDAATALEPAWSAQDKLPLRLPVYFHWEFTTASGGDFRSLVERLKRQRTLDGVGMRKVDISKPGFGMPEVAGDEALLDGALRPEGMAPPEAPSDFAGAIAPLLAQQEAVTPPLYARWHAARTAVPAAGIAPDWLRELNVVPARRVAAGLGTRVVQERQEEIMAAAWEQVGEILRANQRLREGQLALAASEALHARHFAAVLDAADPAALALAGPALGRIRGSTGRTVQAEVVASCLPLLAVCGGFRRMTRPRGPLMRRLARRSDVPPPLSTLLRRLGDGTLRDQPPASPNGAVILPPTTTERLIDSPALLADAGLAAQADEGNTALRELLDEWHKRGEPVPCEPLRGATIDAVRTGLVPAATIPARVQAQVRLPPGRTHRPQRIDEVMAAPDIPTPMSLPLIELGQDWLLPGLGEVPPESIALLLPNWQFIEAYMAGLNHEMARELLWRGYPTDQRGTVFRRFWDRAAAVPLGPRRTGEDIEPIHAWNETTPLGDHGAHPPDGPLILLIRGELLRRYPRATVFMQRGSIVTDSGGQPQRRPDGAVKRLPMSGIDAANTLFPAFSGRLEPDVTFLGFSLSAVAARGDGGQPGWFIAFQEQPTEPRFGLVETSVTGTEWHWRDLSWADVALTPGGHIDVDVTSKAAVHDGKRPSQLGLSPQWDGRADTLAAITLNPAFRLFVHASDLLP